MSQLAARLTSPQNKLRKQFQRSEPGATFGRVGQKLIVTLACGATSIYGPSGRLTTLGGAPA